MSKALLSNPRALAPALCSAMALALLALPAAASAETCPNATERFGASANLPDCRAYELVSPAIKEDNGNLFNAFGYADGEHVVWNTIAPIPGAKTGAAIPVLSSRTASGWGTTSLSPPQGPGEADTTTSYDNGDLLWPVSFTSDFSTAFVNTPYASDPLDQNLGFDVYRVNIADGSSSIASLPDTGAMLESFYYDPTDPNQTPGSFIAGNSADGSRVYFNTLAQLPTAPGTPVETQPVGNEVYERHGEHTYLLGVLPDGSVPTCGAEIGEGGATGIDGPYQNYNYGAVSADGSNVVFHSPAEHISPGQEDVDCQPGHVTTGSGAGLYLREDNGTPSARTVRLPGVVYLGRTTDGSKILSGGDNEGDVNGGPIYEYDIATEQATQIGIGSLLTYSADGSRVYYLSHPSFRGYGDSEQQLEVYDNGITKTIPNAGPAYVRWSFKNLVEPLEAYNGLGLSLESIPVTTPDGSKLLFLDRANLTSYNADGPDCAADNGGEIEFNAYLVQNCAEAYIYDLTTGSFTCVSCDPSGAPPSSNTKLFNPPAFDQYVPQTTGSLSEDGSRAFFETANALVPQDTNGQSDVYEWENGHIYLLSSGQGSEGSLLDGVSSNGDDVFFQTSDVLLPQDVESSTQIYDARVGGGFPYTTPVYGCDSGQCQGPQTPAPVFSPPASATFVGVGNPASPTPTSSAKSKATPKRKVKAKPKRKAKRKAKAKRATRIRNRDNRNGKGKS